MYITKIVLDNIRCFKHIELPLSSGSNILNWTIILGDNGIGKTTLLRSIALGLVGKNSVTALLSELYGEWIRSKSPGSKGVIRIEMKNSIRSDMTWWVETTIKRTKSGDYEVTQDTGPSPKEFPWSNIFICGYGAARRAYGTKDYNEYSSVDSVYTLFNYDSPLQNAELVLWRLRYLREEKITKMEPLQQILNWIDYLLLLPKGSTKLGFDGIQIKGSWGEFVPIGALGDGYQATLAWIVDFLGWAMFYDRDAFKKEKSNLSGIVLLDEIEQHLHPCWQKEIISLLYTQFPKVQFITTTHAPLCAIGAANLSDDDCGLFLLKQEDDQVTTSPRMTPPRHQRADQVLTSYLFGLNTTSSDQTIENIQRYSNLASRPTQELTDKEKKELHKLKRQLTKELGSGETELQKIAHNTINQVLVSRTKKEITKKALDFEVRRQLKQLLEEI